jgi:uncharacterized Tic20 family protein
VSDAPVPARTERQLAALGPLLAAAGAFVHPVASTLLPFVLYTAVRSRSLPFAGLAALRAADLAFSIYLWHVIASLLLVTSSHFQATAWLATRDNMAMMTAALLIYFFVSLAIGLIQALRGKQLRYVLSFSVAERVLGAVRRPG